MTVLGTLPNDKSKLVALYVNENSKYQTNLSRLDLAKRIVQDPNESPERRAEFKIKYDKYKKEVEDGRLNRQKLQQAVDKLEGGKELTKINEDVADLLEAKSFIIDPNDPDLSRIDAKIEKLVKPFQDAYSKTVGARISETIARSKLVKKEIPTFGETAQVANTLTAVIPDKKETPSLIKTPEKKVTPKETAPTTLNPATGEVIKVSDIKPNDGVKTPPALVGPNALPPVDKTTNAANIIVDKFDLSEALFKNVPGLKTIYEEYVSGKTGMTDEEFIKRVRQDTWFLKNSKEIKARFVQFYNYQDMKNSGQADGSTDYEMEIKKIESNLRKNAVIIGSDIGSDPDALTKIAEDLYITNRSEDDSFITDLLATRIRPISGMIGGKPTEGYSGQALQNYNTLLQTARNNGFKISDILPGGANEQQVLAGIASGKIDINRVAQDARKLAAQGQPQYVRDLLSQGYDLAQVFAPYRQTMANILGINDPNQIDLNDETLRMAITDKGDMNLYDFKKTLRQDKRWQYTEQAKEDVSTAAFNVLRDFGFQG